MADERKQVVVRLPPDLIRRIGHLAIEQQRTKQATIEELLSEALDLRENQSKQRAWGTR